MSVLLNVLCDVGIVGRSAANASCGAACGAGDIDSTSGDSVTASREKFGTSTSANTLPRKFRRRFTYRDDVIRIFGAGYWRKGKQIYEYEHQIHE